MGSIDTEEDDDFCQKQRYSKSTCFLFYVLVFSPIAFYLFLFFLNPYIKKFIKDTCEPNFIVKLDLVFFIGAYQLVDYIQNPIFDLISAIPYVVHYTLPFLYSGYLLFLKKDFRLLFKYILSLGLVCSIGVLTQYILPTPPPWMITTKQLPPEAYFYRVDDLLDIKFFKFLYSKSPLVCGAFPSLHAAWPALILFNKPWISLWFSWLHVGLIGFAAIYSFHHYVIDVLAGFLLAWFGCLIGKYSIDKLYPRKLGYSNRLSIV
jgi:membrane-associated phospholipid phosphatase